MKNKNQYNFETSPIGRLIASYAIPSVVSLVVNALYNIIDQIFIGHGVGYLGNGSTTVVFPLTVAGTAFALLFGDGGAAYLSMKLGEGNKNEAKKGVENTILLLICSSLILCIVFSLLLHPLLKFLGGTEAIMPYAVAYGRIIIAGLPLMMISTGLNSLIRAAGKPSLSMTSMLLGALTNTILDPIFIFVFNWGVKGAATATVIGQFISFIFSIGCMFKIDLLHVKINTHKFDAKTSKNCVLLGMSSFIMQVVVVFMNTICNNLLTKYGAASIYGPDIPITAFGIILKINQILISILVGLAVGSQPIAGYNYGAGNMKRVKETYCYLIKISLMIGAIAFIIFQLFTQNIISLFGTESELYNDFSIKALRIFLSMCIAVSFQVPTANFMQAIGKVKQSILSALLRQFIIFVPMVCILPVFLGVDGVLWAGPVADLGSAIITGFMIYFVFHSVDDNVN